MPPMRVRYQTSRMIATLVLTICLVCPLIELFDTWDHTLQTGNDNEYALVILSLTVGITYSFVRGSLFSPSAAKKARVSSLPVRYRFPSLRFARLIPASFVPISPPCFDLRI